MHGIRTNDGNHRNNMNSLSKIFINVGKYLLFFSLLQGACVLIIAAIVPEFASSSWALGISMFMSSALTAILFLWRKWWIEDIDDTKGVNWLVYLLLLLLSIATFLPSLGLLEMMGVKANESQERIIMEIISSPLGFVVIAILVPLAEEIVFRGAILRALLEFFKKMNLERGGGENGRVRAVWIPIIISSVLFGTVHGNLAQFIHATLLGILLGWLYCNTKTILPGVVMHFLNNGLAFVLVKLDPTSNDASLIEMFGGNELAMWLSICVSIAVALLSISLLHVFFKSSATKRNALAKLRNAENNDID